MLRSSAAAIRVLSIVGTRSEAIKMAPVVREISRRGLQSRVCVTGQHREMLDDVLRTFDVRADYDLGVMRARQSPVSVGAAILDRLEPVLQEEQPDRVLVQGGTATAALSGLAAFYSGIRVGHVEAGLRSHTPREPFPEEVNRRVVSTLADLHFAPTEAAEENLRREGVDSASIVVTGNTVIDALHQALELPTTPPSFLEKIDESRRVMLVTTHRRESFGEPLRRICRAVRALAESHDDLRAIFPVHPNPKVTETVRSELSDCASVRLVEPLSYPDLVHTLQRAHLVLTDSGGLQEEAPALGTPVLVLRDVTERREGVDAGAARLVGTRASDIVSATRRILADEDAYAQMARAVTPYGDGFAAARIVEAVLAVEFRKVNAGPHSSSLGVDGLQSTRKRGTRTRPTATS